MTTEAETPFAGYRLEALDNKYVAYRLTGPRGGITHLVRYAEMPSLLFASPQTKSNGGACLVNGHSLFTDRGGFLRVATARDVREAKAAAA